ncbi:transmembrane 220 family protein [Chryseosolibacter indicus]|uniref:Transmembrane family 220 protein n=1 Tax=Chryseosolibacter indicus TaxID=2782351 RepID=A0ABS5VK47_9BACT|nr:transmembrane 220 family protein [Chryseosolibacter indicus]MBT1701815.1 hypothetical protein [Chryseosolibacter indicus]
MKAVNLLLAVMFLVFAFVQINDPDPVVWILAYGAMAVICILAAFKVYFRIFMVVLLIAYVGYSLFFIDGVAQWLAQDNKSILFDDVAKMEYPYVESSREFLGLMICIIILVIHLVLSRKRSPAS